MIIVSSPSETVHILLFFILPASEVVWKNLNIFYFQSDGKEGKLSNSYLKSKLFMGIVLFLGSRSNPSNTNLNLRLSMRNVHFWVGGVTIQQKSEVEVFHYF